MPSNCELEALVTDARFQELKFRQEKTNVFTIVGQTHTEHWHSAFMAWLLDANTSLRLGHFPLARLLTLYMIKKPDCGYTLRDIYRWNLDAVRFSTEKDASSPGKKRSIDVYGESSELILVIENKVNAKENYNNSDRGQTQDYYDYVEAHKKPGQKALYFFITADQNQTAYSDRYVRISYQEMYDSIISKCIEHPQVSQDGKYLLEQYAANLRETIRNTNKPMALVHIPLCRALYSDYADTLDATFSTVENTDDLSASNEPACMVYEHYKSVFDEIYLSVDEKYGRTPKNGVQRQSIDLNDLYRRGLITDNTRFTMHYDGETYYARPVLNMVTSQCCFMLLHEDGTPYISPDNPNVYTGIYSNPSVAGLDAINSRREELGIQNRVKTLAGATAWVNENGKTFRDLMSM